MWSFASRHLVALACVATLLVHLLSLTRRLGPDEGGFAMVARHWLDGGPYLYGPEWVDRPPGLIAVFDAAQYLGPYGVRLAAILLAVALVAAVGSAARTLGGQSAAAWAAWAAFAFGSSTLLAAQELNGELAAATFVAISVAALVHAIRISETTARPVTYGALAGASAIMAVLMKQNFVDAFVFAAVLLAGCALARADRRTHRTATVLNAALGFASGVVMVSMATLAWADGHGGPDALAYAMFGFRRDAATVIANWSWAAPQHRLGVLLQVAVLSGLLLLLAHLALSHGRRLRDAGPLRWAVAATIGVELFGVFAGENFWSHYLIALIPTVTLAAGLSVNQRAPGWRWTRRLVVLCVAVTAVVSPVWAIGAEHQSSRAYITGRWVAAVAESTDTIVVPFTHANVIGASGLKPGYPYTWSLPVRTLDPDLSLLTNTLSGPTAPTWVVRWDDPHTWGLDPHNYVDAALRAHYRLVAQVCGHPVWLHDGLARELAAPPPASACGAGSS